MADDRPTTFSTDEPPTYEAGERPNPGPVARTRRAGDAENEPRHTSRASGAVSPVKHTKQAEGRRPATKGVLLDDVEAGDVLCDDYVVQVAVRQHTTDRAGLYHCRDAEGLDVLLKAAPPAHPPEREQWLDLPDLQHANVIRTHRVLEYEGLFCDVQEYCSGGALSDRPPGESEVCSEERCDWLMRSVVPQLAAGLAYLHSRGRVHRDVKPANIYVRNSGPAETYVLADLDVSLRLDADGRTRMSDRVALTDEFAAPEAFPDLDETLTTAKVMVTRKMDYYSLGMTLIWLLCGRTPLTGLGDRTSAWYRQGERLALPEGLPERLQTLLRGLLVRHYPRRWGPEETERWLNGETTEEDLAALEADTAALHQRSLRPYKLDDLVAHDLGALARAMQERPKQAARDLLRLDFIINWIAGIDSNIGRAAAADREAYRERPGTAVFAVGLQCDPELPLYLNDGSVYTTPDALLQASLAALDQGAESVIVDDENLLRIELWFRRRVPADPVLADGVAAITDVRAPAKVKLAELGWWLDPARPLEIADGLQAVTPGDVPRLAYGDAANWEAGTPGHYTAALRLYREGLLEAWLRARSLADVAEAVTARHQAEPERDIVGFEATLRLLDPGLTPVKVRFDTRELGRGFRVPFGEQGRKELPFMTEGPGIPAAAVRLVDARAGLQLEAPAEIAARGGHVALLLDSRNDIPVARSHTATLELDSGYTELLDAPARLRYRVSYPAMRTLLYVVMGALLGAVLVGGPRLLMEFLGETGVVGVDVAWESTAPPEEPVDYLRWLEAGTRASMWDRIQWGEFPFWELIVGLVALVVALAIGWRILRWVLRHKAEW
jgi:serine/threonine protein kinase